MKENNRRNKMKLSEIKELVDSGKTVTLKSKGTVKSVDFKNGKYTVKYEISSKPKYYGRLTIC